METPKEAKDVPTVDFAIEALLDELASRTARLVLKQLEGKMLLRPRLVNYEQAAAYLSFLTTDGKPSVSALRQRKFAGHFPESLFVEIGKALKWDLNAVDEWIDSKKPRKGRHTRQK